MDAAASRFEFAPPPSPGILRALGLALVAHAFLMAALTWGVSWRHQATPLLAEAELWSAVPEQASPKLEALPAPAEPIAPPPVPVPEPELKTPPPDIITEQDKLRLLQEKRAKDEQVKDDLKKAEQKKQEAKQTALKQADAAKRAAAQKALDEENRLAVQRQENIKRMAGLAGATGAPAATGTALQSTGPSPSYAGRIRARIKPNIVFGDDIAGNPTATVEVKTSPDGTIISSKLLKSSGVPAWDEAVLKAIVKTEVFPRDTDGRVPPTLEIGFRPKDQ